MFKIENRSEKDSQKVMTILFKNKEENIFRSPLTWASLLRNKSLREASEALRGRREKLFSVSSSSVTLQSRWIYLILHLSSGKSILSSSLKWLCQVWKQVTGHPFSINYTELWKLYIKEKMFLLLSPTCFSMSLRLLWGGFSSTVSHYKKNCYCQFRHDKLELRVTLKASLTCLTISFIYKQAPLSINNYSTCLSRSGYNRAARVSFCPVALIGL